jgi:DNA-binding MarR family transcriptional regulator
MSESADEVWSRMTTLVMDSRGDWRRRAVEAARMPFSRVRVIRRLAAGPMSMRDIAEAATMDAPAVTVAVNDLVARGLVTREFSADSRRTKDVSLTDSGRKVVETIDRIRDVAPAGLCDLAPAELATLKAMLERIRTADR